jgi:hypothetical protein
MHTSTGIHLHGTTSVEVNTRNGWVVLTDGGSQSHDVTVFAHDAAATRALIAALQAVVAAREAETASS